MKIRLDPSGWMRNGRGRSSLLRSAAYGVLVLSTCNLLSGCIVAGVSSTGGGFIWPGGLGLLIIVLVVLFLMRRR